MRTQTPELLAPAGNLVCLHAAVRAGANAVYVGLGEFNARRSAENFTLETFAEACTWAHLRGVCIYVAVNTVVLPSEVDAALRLVEGAAAAGADAFIVQDIGLAAEIARTIPGVALHISTQMNTHNAAGIEAAAALGAKRVTLARELALEEVGRLANVAHALGMEVEVFAHGALCICYSGQCFASSLVGGRSANRGMCAQVCRLPYELHNVALRKTLDAPGEHLLSPKDLCTIDLLPQLASAGVDSLKIEGRMKQPEYAYTTTSTYRAVLDRVSKVAAGKVNTEQREGPRVPSAICRSAVQNSAVQNSSCAPLLHASEEIASQSKEASVQTVASGTLEPSLASATVGPLEEGDAPSVVARSAVQNSAVQNSSCAALLQCTQKEEFAMQSATTGASPSSLGPTDEERQRLEEVFSRGFTQGYLVGETGNAMMSYSRPNNRGVQVGRVSAVHKGMVEIACETPLVEGDIVEFWTNKGHFAHTVDALEQRGSGVVALAVPQPVGKGDRVFRVRSAAAAFADDAQEPRIPVCGTIELYLGQPVRFILQRLGANGMPKDAYATCRSAVQNSAAQNSSCAPLLHASEEIASQSEEASVQTVAAASLSIPIQVEIEGPVVEAAQTKALTEDEVRAHIDRFGTTPFVLMQLDVHMDEGIGMGFSQLHHLRAEAAAALQEQILSNYTVGNVPKAARSGKEGVPPEVFETPFLNDCEAIFNKSSEEPERTRAQARAAEAPSGGTPSFPAAQVCAWATNASCARAAKKAGAECLYVPALNYARGEAVVAGQRSETVEQAGYPKQAIIALPTINHDAVAGSREERFGFDPWKYAKPGKRVFADSLAGVWHALQTGMQVEVGPHVPVNNALTARYFENAGVARIWLSPELSLGQIQRIAEETQVPLGLFISGAAELMITEHCLLQSQGPCNQDCSTCARRKSPHYLKDRKDFEMPVVTDCMGRSHLYNAVPLDACHLLPDLLRTGVSAFMVDTTLLNTAETTAAVSRAVRARNLAQRTGNSIGKLEGTTTGHLFRGVS